MRIIWRHIDRYSVSQGKSILKEEIDFKGRVVGWRKRRASTTDSNRGGGDVGTVGDSVERDAVQRRDAEPMQFDAEGRRATQSHVEPHKVMQG